ncbi:MAG: hypothetical protein JSV35_03885 [Candidatus Bathyarchaeota archaeon]|nr:MAG: hypothetical protein JSV35_03885 [Candidatus Bathyarchaeota archaeon]
MVKKILLNLKMHPFETTMMGVLKGVADYYKIDLSNAWLFGGSGHAFLINIHDQLCPSGPYCWKYEGFYRLLQNLGILMKELGFFTAESTPLERGKIEASLKKNIDAEVPCSMLNMENQLISGYDAKHSHFIVQKPWPKADLPFTPETLTFQTWKELGDEIHVNFFSFKKIPGAHDGTVIKESLTYAVELARNPEKYRLDPCYHMGLDAYMAWINAVKDGHGASHGNWWNGTVWWECRKMASAYFAEIAPKFKGQISEDATRVSNQYAKIAELAFKVSDKKLADNDKIRTLREAKKIEESCIDEIEKMASALSS